MAIRAWKRLKSLPKDESGVIALETTLVFPFQLLITVGLLQLAHLFVASQALQYAVYQGTRSAAISWDGGDPVSDRPSLEERAVRVAWVLLSALHNPGGGADAVPRSLAVLGGSGSARVYGYPDFDPEQLEFRLWISPAPGAGGAGGAGESAEGGEAARLSAAPVEWMFEGEGTYMARLAVPLGGAAVHWVAGLANRDDPGAVGRVGGEIAIRLRQVSYFARPWPG